ncbi:MAG: bifunctional phosphoserine phosphatase/homoserine phosphotransferase ThrH [Treponema sp.]|jgi:phosphoserine/homoserine phosphotransferase|nr:bifunctional phosphoserine phosphatase/homoserine phosphotransferase ThrH [Treponema sp.]
MRLVCLDLEGVLVPEIWIAFSQAAGIPELSRTTRDEPDYGRLMRFRLDLLKKNGLKLPDIRRVIEGMDPLPGAVEFTGALRERTGLVILSDTFEEFAKPLMKKLHWPLLFCNTLLCAPDGSVTGYRLRQERGKREAVRAFASLNVEVFAAGDSFNDLEMIREAAAGCLFRAPEGIRRQCTDIPCVDAYDELLARIDLFLGSPPVWGGCS